MLIISDGLALTLSLSEIAPDFSSNWFKAERGSPVVDRSSIRKIAPVIASLSLGVVVVDLFVLVVLAVLVVVVIDVLVLVVLVEVVDVEVVDVEVVDVELVDVEVVDVEVVDVELVVVVVKGVVVVVVVDVLVNGVLVEVVGRVPVEVVVCFVDVPGFVEAVFLVRGIMFTFMVVVVVDMDEVVVEVLVVVDVFLRFFSDKDDLSSGGPNL